MRKTVFIAVILLVGIRCMGQVEGRPKSGFTYSAGLSYNQIFMPKVYYSSDEYGTYSSPFNWGITPCFSMTKNRLSLHFGLGYSSCSVTRDFFPGYFKTNIHQCKWKEVGASCAVGFRLTGEHQLIGVEPFIGINVMRLIDYEKIWVYEYNNWVSVYDGTLHYVHYNMYQLSARWHFLGLAALGGIKVSCAIAKRFQIGLSYCFKYMIINDIRRDFPREETIIDPWCYHNASLGISYRFN
ncbi:MAG: hypothetical protein HUK16_05675 [Bacteroidales bacterium]|mgnify:CR=1 FL=1|nr:hypothetical protein [Bacteroidales bacterium]